MPPCIINKEVYDFPFESMDCLGKDLQKTNRVSPYTFHDAMPSIDRIYPAKDVQSMLMLGAYIYIRLDPLIGPYPAQLWMQRKSRFIFKEYNPFTFAFFCAAEFFLTLHKTPSLLDQWPGHNDKSATAVNTPASLSAAGHVEHGYISGRFASDTQPAQCHPIASGKARTSFAIISSSN